MKLIPKRSEKRIIEVKMEENKANSSRSRTSKMSLSNVNDIFISGRVQKEKAEMKKIALEKRKKYGKMIQKQVLKMHRKKTRN